jgi:beta-glucosidase
MFRFSLRAAIAAVLVAVAAAAAGGVIAATRSSDEAALQPIRQPADRSIESRVNSLLARMTLEEKLHQIQLLPDFRFTGPAASEGEELVRNGLGAILSLTDPARIRELQRIAVEESRLGIPLLFAFDTIHGFRTIFPIPLGTGASFDPEVAFDDANYGARESTAVGLKQTYAPMVDVSHEPRWGRMSEAAGEDPYLNSVMAAARVKGTQGGDYSELEKLIASPKHFAAYGEPENGRDYNTTDMSIQRLWNLYLPPFKAALDAGADTAMCSFNALNGVPGCGNSFLMNDILKDEWDFDGFVESDWTAVAELRRCPPVNPDNVPECGHGVAEDGPGAAALALNSGVDMEMTSTLIRDFGEQLLDEGRISMRRINDAVRRILRIKFRAGLFENPYSQYTPEQAQEQMLLPDALAAARKAASRSMVLLKNEGPNPVLPLDPTKRTAVIGPLADNQHDMLGPWWGRGDDNDVVSVLDGINEQSPGATHAAGCQLSNGEVPFGGQQDPKDRDPEGCTSIDTAAVNAALAEAQQVVVAVGETREMSGEANVRSKLDLPGRQEELIQAAKASGKPYAVVLFSGRPLALENIVADTPALLEAWFPGVQAGPAVADVVFGKVNPGGKLPASFPYREGQVPIYYNREPTGRPCNKQVKWNSQHRDIPSCDPLFVFGHGLSYTTFEVTNLRLSSSTVSRNGRIRATVDVKNTGSREGDEVVQVYINDPVASISQPIRRLRGFERVTLEPGQSRTVTFTLDKSDFGFYDDRGRLVVESGQIDVYAGNSSAADMKQSFTVR